MSLHGLDAPVIAHAAAAVKEDSAGWFLLKYATRDEIELYSTGTGGIPNAAASISTYEEKSPLYGIVTHVGKKVLIRYVPSGTSRLLQARVKVHFDAISAHFPHDSELPITQADELTGESLTAAAPAPAPSSTSLPLSPAISFSNPASPIPSSLGRIPSNAGSSSAHGSSVNGESAIKEEGESDTPSSRTAKLLADVRAGKLESHEVLAALKITSTRDSDRRPSDTSSDRLRDSANALRAEETARNGSVSSLDPQLVQFPSPRPSLSSGNNVDLYKAKVKVGPRPSHSADSSTGSHVATLPAGVSLPKPATPTQSPSAQASESPKSIQFVNTLPGLGESYMRPIVQSPASVVSATGKAGSTTASVMTLPATLGERKGSGSSLQGPRDQQAVEKMRLMRALEIQRKKQAKNRSGDDPPSAEPSPGLPSALNSPIATGFEVPTALGSALDRGEPHFPQQSLPEVDIAAARSLHAATKSSPTLGSMVNFPLHERRADVATSTIDQKPEIAGTETSPSGKEAIGASDAQTPSHPTGTLKSRDRIPAPINTNVSPETSHDEGQRTPVAAVRVDDQNHRAGGNQPDPDIIRPDFARMHSAHVSISTSISGTSSFLEELESSNVEQAQPMTLVKSPITPTFPRSPGLPKPSSFAPSESKLRDVQDVVPAPVLETPVSSTQSPPQAIKEEVEDRSEENGSTPTQMTNSAADQIEVIDKPRVDESSLTPANEAVTAEPAQNIPPAAPERVEPQETPIQIEDKPVEQPDAVPVRSTRIVTPAAPGAGATVIDPMKAIIEAELGATPIPASKDLAANVADSIPDPSKHLPNHSDAAEASIEQNPQQVATPEDDNVEPLTIPKGGSPSIKKHPTVQPPQIWGGALRSASNPLSDTPRHLSPVPDLAKMTRSASVASNNSTMLRPDSPSGIKKVGVGSRIADRIKALEKSSGAGASSSPPVYASSVASISSRKSSFHTPPGSSGTDTRRIGSSSPNNIFARRFGTVHGTTGADRTARTSPTASPESLRESPATASSDTQPPAASRPAYLRHKSSDSHNANFSLPPSRDGAASTHSQNKSKSSFSSWTGRRDSGETQRTGHSRQSSVESTGTNSDKKKENKAKKLMKRMSGAFSPRKERSAPTFGEPIMESAEPEPPKTAEPSRTSRPVTRDEARGGMVSRGSSRPATKASNNIVVGEVNVQFPDTLLWKRRHVELDGEGNIILAASVLEKTSRVAPKKFHISDFRRPYVPDQEREELPYSIVLDFHDSSTLQCACQNAVDQKNVLQALLQFHARYSKA